MDVGTLDMSLEVSWVIVLTILVVPTATTSIIDCDSCH